MISTLSSCHLVISFAPPRPPTISQRSRDDLLTLGLYAAPTKTTRTLGVTLSVRRRLFVNAVPRAIIPNGGAFTMTTQPDVISVLDLSEILQQHTTNEQTLALLDTGLLSEE